MLFRSALPAFIFEKVSKTVPPAPNVAAAPRANETLFAVLAVTVLSPLYAAETPVTVTVSPTLKLYVPEKVIVAVPALELAPVTAAVVVDDPAIIVKLEVSITV